MSVQHRIRQAEQHSWLDLTTRAVETRGARGWSGGADGRGAGAGGTADGDGSADRAALDRADAACGRGRAQSRSTRR